MDATLHALDILTEDCWREVFQKVWCPADLKSCSETCSTFEGILEGKKTTWMWHAILPHVLQYLSTPQGPGANQWRWGRNWNGLYTCRLACKGWRQAVDHYLETKNDYFQGIAVPSSESYSFDFGEDDFEEFPEMYENFTGNPFIGRFIRIETAGGILNPPQVAPPNHDHIANLRWMLTRFGPEIRSLFITDNIEMRHLDFCKNVHTILSLLPNLKSLYLDPSRFTLWRWDADLSQLPAFLATSPLPDHPHLENLALNHLSIRMGGPLLEKYGPQLKRLRLYEAKPFQDNVGRFEHLEQLQVCINGSNGSLEELRQLRSPLQMLHIHVWLGYGIKSLWPIHEIISNSQHLPLTELWISSQNYIEGKLSSFPNSLQHGSVRRVKITTMTACALSCNFLRCFPNLAQVDFDYRDEEIAFPGSRNKNNLITVTSNEEAMYDSGIWDVLPHLQTITVKSRELKAYRRSTLEMRRLEETIEILADLFQDS